MKQILLFSILLFSLIGSQAFGQSSSLEQSSLQAQSLSQTQSLSQEQSLSETQSLTPIPPTGLPYIIIVDAVTINSQGLSPGDSLAVTDGELVVGAAQYNGSYPLVITAWQGDASLGLPGFTPGNTIGFLGQSRIYNTDTIFEPEAVFANGDGTFGSGAYSTVSLSYQSELTPDITLSVDEIDFGSVRIGDSKTRTFTLSNTGDVPLRVSQINPPTNRISVQYENQLIYPGYPEEVTLVYSPNQAVPLTGNLVIRSDDPDEPEVLLPLSGQGLPALAPVLSVEPSPLIPAVGVVGETITRVVNVYNRGTGTLEISGVNSSNTGWLQVSMGNASLEKDEFAELTLTITPQSFGQQGASIQFQSNATNGSSVGVSIFGYAGYQPQPVETGLPYTVIIDHLFLDTSVVPLGTEVGFYAGDTVVGHAVYRGSMPIVATVWQEYVAVGLPGFTIGDPIEVQYSTSIYDSTITVSPEVTMLVGDGTYGSGAFSRLGISGQSGIAPKLELAQEPLYFGELQLGETSVQSIMLRNEGESPLILQSLQSSGAFSITPTNQSEIAPGSELEVELTFSGTVVGLNTGTFTVVTNDPYRPSAQVALRGRTLIDLPEERLELVDPDPQVAVFDVATGEETMEEITFRNRQGSTQQVTFSLEGLDGGVLSETEVEFLPNQERTLEVEFQIAEAGEGSFDLVATFGEGEGDGGSGDGDSGAVETFSFRYVSYDPHFPEPQPTGLPYTMLVDLGDNDIWTAGDQLAVYDGTTSVGTARVVNDTSRVPIVAWRADPSLGLPGFTPGNAVRVHVFSAAEPGGDRVDFVPLEVSFSGDGTFGYGAYQTVSLVMDRSLMPAVPELSLVDVVGSDVQFEVDLKGDTGTEAYFCVSDSPKPVLDMQTCELIAEPDAFLIIPLEEFDDDVRRYVRVYVENDTFGVYSNELSYDREELRGIKNIFSLVLNVADAGGLEKDLTVGTRLEATTGFDVGFDVLAPPPPPSGSFDARIKVGNQSFFTFYHPPTLEITNWRIQFAPETGNAPITINWDASSLPEDGAYMIVDVINGSFVNVDMREQSSVTIEQSFISEVNFVHELTREVQTTFRANWDLVGLPVEVDDATYSGLFPTANPNTLYAYDGTYTEESALLPGRGYWLNFASADQVTFDGFPIRSLSLNMRANWNLISGLTENTQMIDTGNILLPGSLYGYDGFYFEADYLEPGNGYWVAASANGTIELDEGGGSVLLFNRPRQDKAITDLTSRLIFLSGDREMTELVVGEELLGEYDPLQLQFPPVPPQGSFDVRFEGDRWITDKEHAVVHLQHNAQPMQMKVAGQVSVEVLMRSQGVTIDRITVEPDRSVTIPQSIDVLQVSLFEDVSDSDLPNTFALRQNYPNPFNPSTMIQYDLPKSVDVQLEVFNMLGQRVAILADVDQQSPGSYEVAFDASELSSGMYMYRLIAGDFIKTHKMMLLK